LHDTCLPGSRGFNPSPFYLPPAGSEGFITHDDRPATAALVLALHLLRPERRSPLGAAATRVAGINTSCQASASRGHTVVNTLAAGATER